MGVNVTEPGSPLKQTWPTLSTAVLSPFTWVDTWLMINIVIVSQIFWPGEPLRVSEMGLLAGTAILSEGVFALLFGLLADRYSRKKIMMIATLLHGCLFALQGLMPAGLGNVSFYVFLGLNLARSAVFGYRQPLETSYTDDVVHEEKRSMYFGTSMLLERLGSIAGAIIATSIFVQGWRYYFFFVGGVMATVGVFIGLKAREPKRGSMRKELKSILSVGNASYDYQLKMDTVKSTLFSKTNIVALIEGLFTNFIISFPLLLFFACYESPPYNMAPLTISLIMVTFGTPGAIIGAIILAGVCDKLSKNSLKARIYFIIASVIVVTLVFIMLFHLPIEFKDGENFIMFHGHFENWLVGLCFFFGQMVIGLYYINQSPFLQALNLPEAQGATSSLNKFLELVGRGVGLVLSGFVLTILNYNYQLTILLMMSAGMVGAFIWTLALKWVDADHARITRILDERADKLKNHGDTT